MSSITITTRAGRSRSRDRSRSIAGAAACDDRRLRHATTTPTADADAATDPTDRRTAGPPSPSVRSDGDRARRPTRQVTISYFTFSAAPDHLEDLDAIIAAFEAENPNITIETQTASYDDYFTSLQTQIAGGTAPDTFELNYENFVTYARSGALLDLGARRDRHQPLLPARARGLPGRRHAVRPAGDVLRRRADLQHDAVRRRRTRLPVAGLDLGGRARRGRGTHRRADRRLRIVTSRSASSSSTRRSPRPAASSSTPTATPRSTPKPASRPPSG